RDARAPVERLPAVAVGVDHVVAVGSHDAAPLLSAPGADGIAVRWPRPRRGRRSAGRTTTVNTPLAGRVALVTGATRGIGKGIALELGAAGATVYLTGRTVDAGALPGTIGETVAEIAALGGIGIALRCDHRDDAQVETVFAQVRGEHGRLDVLVNNVYSSPDLVPYIGRPFWELPMAAWDDVIDVGLRSHYVATAFAAPMMVERGEGLVVNVSSSGAIGYAHTVAYGVGKAALDRMTADTAHELHAHGVA